MAEEKRQFNAEQAIAQEQLNIQKAQAASSGRGASNPNYSKNRSKTTGKTYSAGVKKSSGSGSVKKDSGSKKTTKKSEPTPDMNSVLALGFGPISASKLNSLVKSGVVVEYESGGKLKYKKSASTLKQSMLFK
jgi:hypothetical protein